MKYNWVEVLAGAFVLALAIFFASFAFRSHEFMTSANSYPLYAEFISAEGIAPGGDVRMAGVKVGRVGDMSLNRENYTAKVELLLMNDVEVPKDSEVKIASSGLIGGAFVEIVPGGDIVMFERGEQFVYVSSPVSLLGLISKFIAVSDQQESQ